MSKKIRNEATDGLFHAILSLETMEECYTFFEDVCTINELLSLSQRFEVAKMLREQKTYLEIAEKTGARVKETWLTGQSAQEAIGTLIAGGEYPDFIDGGDGCAQLYDAGALVALDDCLLCSLPCEPCLLYLHAGLFRNELLDLIVVVNL